MEIVGDQTMARQCMVVAISRQLVVGPLASTKEGL